MSADAPEPGSSSRAGGGGDHSAPLSSSSRDGAAARDCAPAPPTAKPADRGRAGLLRRTLAGLPELDQFPTPEQRDAAAESVVAGITPARGEWWIGFAILVGTVGTWALGVRAAVPLLRLPGVITELLQIALIAGLAFVVIRWLHRSGAQTVLRQRLIEAGVAVCVRCGYDLRGQPAECARCPECGNPIDERVTALLRARDTAPRA